MSAAMALRCATGAFAPKWNRMLTPPGEVHRLWRWSRPIRPLPGLQLSEDTDTFPGLRGGTEAPIGQMADEVRGHLFL